MDVISGMLLGSVIGLIIGPLFMYRFIDWLLGPVDKF